MTFEKLKETLDTLTAEQLQQTVAVYFGHDFYDDVMIVSTPEGELVFIPELNLKEGGEDVVESS
jgi:hypothetical protein